MLAYSLLLASSDGALALGLVVTTYAFGLRHGIDWDHIAAISDITSSQDTPRRSVWFATLYALGHALVVFALGMLAIVFAEKLPPGVDEVMERLVGLTLLLLGIYVLVALVRHGRDFRMRSRWMLVLSGIRRAVLWVRRRRRMTLVTIDHDHAHGAERHHPADDEPSVTASPVPGGELTTVASRHRHRHRHVAPIPDDPFANYGQGTSLVVGMIHGVGAETPTQLVLFLTAAGAGGTFQGVFLLVVFLAGLVTSNTGIALAGTFGFLGSSRRFGLYAGISLATGVLSLGLGMLFLVGKAAVLPGFFAG